MRLVPPSGSPIPFGTFIASLFESGVKASNGFDQAVQEYTSAKHRFYLSSGRAAQTVILQAMAQTSNDEGKDEVIMPAYTCFTVAASIARAGLKIRTIDIDPSTLDYNYDKLNEVDFSRILAINASNLFGLVSDMEQLREISKRNSVYLIDDAAQSFGSRRENKISGCLGDIGFYSLDRGKNLAAYSGSIIVTNDDQLASKIEEITGKLVSESSGGLSLATKLFLYMLFLRPSLYWIPASLPFLGLGETHYDDQFDISQLGRIQKALGRRLLAHLDEHNSVRTENSRRLADPIITSGKYMIPGYEPNRELVYLRLPLLAENRDARDKAIADLRNVGIIASSMYPSVIEDIPGISEKLAKNQSDSPGARDIVNRLFTLPTHMFLKDSDIEKIVSTLI